MTENTPSDALVEAMARAISEARTGNSLSYRHFIMEAQAAAAVIADAEDVHAEDEDAWCIVEYKDVATPSARITGDKDRGSPVEGAPYGEGLIGRIDTLEVKNAELRRALAYAQGEQLRLMQERHELERQLKVAREALIWCSGSNDFNEGGQAREGWLKLCAPLLARAALGSAKV